MLGARLISFLAIVSMIAQPMLAEKCTQPSYAAPYNLGDTVGELKTSSVVNPGSVYYIVPCGTVNQGLCADSNATEQECYAYTDKDGKEQSDSLGTPMNSTWSSVDSWFNGATSLNKDIKVGETTMLCDASLEGSFTTVYHCAAGDDSTLLVTEPQSVTDACVFEIHVDSSVLCKYQRSMESSSSSSSTGSESSSSSDESSSSMIESSSSGESSSFLESSSIESSSVVSSSAESSSAESSSAFSSSMVSSSAESSSVIESSSSQVDSSSAQMDSSSSSEDKSSSSGMPIMSSSSDMPMASSSSDAPILISSSSYEESSSTGEDAGDSGWSTAAEIGVGLGIGLGSLVIILLIALIYFIRKLHNAIAEKNTLLVEDGSTSGRSYNSIKNAEEGRGSKKNKNDRLI